MTLLRAVVALFAGAQAWLQVFPVDVGRLVTGHEAPFFVLEPGYESTFESAGHGKAGKPVSTVLNETRKVGGVDTRVVEEREWSGGELIEVSRNYFAIDPPSGDLSYFGEEGWRKASPWIARKS